MTTVAEQRKEAETGRAIVKVKLTNFSDLIRSEAGEIPPEQVRSVEKDGLVDTGATMLVGPEEIAQQRGLPIAHHVNVTYADGRKEKRGIARGVVIEIMGRDALVEAIVEAPAANMLIGQVPLEVMDLITDPKAGTVGPRPDSSDAPLIELYEVASALI